MVRLIVTDYDSKDDYESFYGNINEFEPLQEIFVYNNYKKSRAYLPKSEIHNNIYSLNLLSKKYIDNDNFLIFISDSEFYILFNHKTIYSAKINENFITDDMIKSILIAKHLTMLSSGGTIDKIHYIIDSKYKFAIDNILKQNTKNEKNQIIAHELGHIGTLVKKIPEMDTSYSFARKNGTIISLIVLVFIFINQVFPYFESRYFEDKSLDKFENDLKIEKRVTNRLLKNYDKINKEFKDLTQCITLKNGESND